MSNYCFKIIACYILSLLLFLNEDLKAQKSIPDLDYAFRIGAGDEDIANSIAIDQFNNTYITGSFSGFTAVDFDPSTSNSFNMLPNNQTNNNFYLAKYSSSGAFLWATQLGSQPGSSVGKKVLVDKRGLIYVIGEYSGTGLFDLDPSSNTFTVNGNYYENIFISVFDNNGNFIDGAGIDSPGEVFFWDATLDDNSNLYLSGFISDTTDLAPSSSKTTYFYTASGNRKGFLLQLDSSLDYSWHHNFNAYTLAKLSISNNNLIFMGNNSSSIDLDPDTSVFFNNHSGGTNIFLSSISSHGNLLWAKIITRQSQIHAVTVDNKDSIILLLYANNPGSIYPDSITNVTSTGTNLLKFSNNGSYSKSKLVSSRNLSLNNMVTDSRNNIYATGSLDYQYQFCIDPNGKNECYNDPYSYLQHLFYIMYDENLNYQWSYDLDCDDSECSSQLSIDTSNSLVTSGSFSNYLGTDFDPSSNSFILRATNSSSFSPTDIFISKLIDSCDLYATGIPNLIFNNNTCTDFHSRFLYSSSFDTISVINYSCDTAYIDSMVMNGGFNIQSNLLSILPLDTVGIVIEFSPVTLGNFNDSLKIYYQNGRVLKKCIRASSTQAPSMTINYPLLDTLTVNGCNDSIFAKVNIINNGLGVLTFLIDKRINYNNLVESRISDSVLAIDTQEVSIKLDVSQLNYGYQTITLFIESDDPLNPLDSVLLIVNKTNVPCSDYDFTVGNCNGFVDFTNRSIGNPTQTKWIFGDGDSSTSFNTSQLYLDTGTYVVSLISCSSFGCDTISKNINISSIIGPRPACIPSTISSGGYGISRFRLNSIDKISNRRGYEDFTCTESTRLIRDSTYNIIVDFGTTFQGVFIWIDYNNDGQFGINERVMPAVVRTGVLSEPFTVRSNATLNYPLRLRVGSWAPGTNHLTGCNTTHGAYKDYTVVIESKIEKPKAKFAFNVIDNCSRKVSFIDTSYNFATSRRWFFGDGSSSLQKNPTHTYSNNGTYQVTLISSNSFGSDTISKNIVVKGNNTYSTLNPLVCNSYLSPSGKLMNQSSNYFDTIPNSFGCDSIIQINLVVNTIDTTIHQNGFQLISNQSNASYQWLDCNNNYSPILNDTNKVFNVFVNGAYSVEIIKGACMDTSECVSVVNVGLAEKYPSATDIIIKPNPTNGRVLISNLSSKESFNLELYNSNSQLLFEKNNLQNNFALNINQSKGIYYLRVISGDNVKVFKLIKQ